MTTPARTPRATLALVLIGALALPAAHGLSAQSNDDPEALTTVYGNLPPVTEMNEGPRIEGILWGEDCVEVQCSPASSIMVLGRGSSAAQAVAPLQTRAVLPLEKLRDGGFARIVVVDAAGKRAWSNPYFF